MNYPKLPCIWLGSECGFLIYENLSEFGNTSIKSLLKDSYSKLKLYSIDGSVWGINVKGFPKFNILDKALAYTFHNRNINVELEFYKQSNIGLEELKTLILLQSKKDPGDLMWQFIDPDEIEKEIPNQSTFQDLFYFCENRILGGGIE